MKLSNKWLNEYVKITAEPKEFADRMTMSGSKAEGFEDQSVQMKNVVAGRVTAIERHPDSDHMWVTEIDVGEDAPITIVTGAQNVSLGDTVPVAKHKSLLPTGQKIEKGKLRGIKSEGMLCSLSELCLDTHDYPECIEDGIMILAGVNQPSVTGEDILPGQDIRQVLGLDDVITDFEITNNRPDCLSVIGLAREAAVTFGAELTLRTPEIKSADAADNIEKHLKITVMDAALCPRYTAKMIKDIKIAPSPVWLRRFLRASGVRPINNIVDITNLVMLEYGQPMHAFDYKCLTGGEIVVRTAAPGETITTLDGNVRGITPDMLVIADSSRPVGLAGVMGGENSEITEDTKYAVFESALFDGVSIRRAASALGMRTDASSRFEKGLDIENTLPAVERACELVELLGAGTVLGGTIDVRSQAQTVREIAFEPDKINALLGTDIPEAFMRKTLTALGFSFNGGTVKIPSWRGDVEHYSDLAEEAARFYGYDKIAPRLYLGRETSGGLNSRQSAERRVSSCLRAAGYSEVYTYSFIGTEDYDKINMPKDEPLRNGITILNPLGAERAVMRATPLPSMLEILENNKNAGNSEARLFELARVYRKNGNIENQPAEEIKILTLGAFGDTDFYAVKGAVEAVLAEFGITGAEYAAQSGIPSFHPGRCADILIGGKKAGIIGQAHPSVAEKYGLADCFLAELSFDALLENGLPVKTYSPLPKFPAAARDLAIVADKSVTAAQLRQCILKSGGEYIVSAELFDVYEGANIGAGKKSAAFSLIFRADDRTLTDAEVDAYIVRILETLAASLGAQLRA